MQGKVQDHSFTDRYLTGRTRPGDYAACHAEPSEGLDTEEKERLKVDNGEDIQVMRKSIADPPPARSLEVLREGPGVPEAHGGREAGQDTHGQGQDAIHGSQGGAGGPGGDALQGGEDRHPGGAGQEGQRARGERHLPASQSRAGRGPRRRPQHSSASHRCRSFLNPNSHGH